jgi:hypothetical protein
MKRLLVLILLPALLQARDWKRVWKATAMSLSWAVAADINTSLGGRELNPVLGRGPYGLRQAAISSGITAGALLWQWHRLRRRNPDDKAWRNATISNLVSTGVHVGVAIHNVKARQ